MFLFLKLLLPFANSKEQTPGIGNVPVIGNLFKGKSSSDNLDELLVFIAPRIL